MTAISADRRFEAKVSALLQICVSPLPAAKYPRSLSDLADWTNENLGLEKFSRPILYKKSNEALRRHALQYIEVCKQRWEGDDKPTACRLRELEALVRLLSGKYHEERALRLDTELRLEAANSAKVSLVDQLRKLSKTPIRLVAD